MELVAGVDEVGRGAWFGPVVAAAVIVPLSSFAYLRQGGVRDSKKLRPPDRERLNAIIRQTAIAVSIGEASVAEIDRLNILQASLLAMERAIDGLCPSPHHCLIDGNQRVPFEHIAPVPQTVIIRGDSVSIAIGAASIVAKVWRDQLLVQGAEGYPGYDLARNKGYGTPRHRQGILDNGLTDQHRRSFRLPTEWD